MKFKKINISEVDGSNPPNFPYGTVYLDYKSRLVMSDGVNGEGSPLLNTTIRGDGYSEIRFVPNSSGDGAGYTTIQLKPDLNTTSDQYLIVDPTAPGHIHLRAGGTQDNSGAELILGGEASFVKVGSGLNPPVTVRAGENNWIFNNNGNVIVPSGPVPTHSTGSMGDAKGTVAIDDGYLYYCTDNYAGYQVTVATLYNGGTSINSNLLQLTETSETLQISVGDIIEDNLGNLSEVGTISSDGTYTYVGTGPGGAVAFNCQFPLTFSSPDFNGDIWKRVAWSNDIW